MWWCCGKQGKESLGCKFSKHESKEDDEDDADGEEKLKEEQRLKYVRCLCCKEVGHKIEDCPRDPNMKTNKEIDEEDDRINQIKDFRKLFSDTMILTTQFFKRCVKVPMIKTIGDVFKEIDTPSQSDYKAAAVEEEDENNQQMEVYYKDPFKRGVMRFEDYNYNIYNKYILIDTEKGAKLNKMGYNNISKMDSDQLRLTQSQLSQSVHENYIFDDIQGCLPSLVKVE